MKWVVGFCSALLLSWSAQAFSQPLSLSEEERAWIEAHPVVRMSQAANFKPFEYIENGRAQGVVSEYIAFIEKQTGLRFEAIPSSDIRQERIDQFQRGEVDVVPAVARQYLPEGASDNAVFTDPYYSTSSLIIARKNGPAVFDLRRLNGHVLALKTEYGHEEYIRTHYPEIRILEVPSLEDALIAVADGRAEFAIEAAPLVLSYLRDSYDEILDVAGTISSLPVDISMAVQSDMPLLHSIISKALASLTAEQVDEMVQRQIDSANSARPTLGILLRYYGTHIALALLGVAFVVGLALHARQQRRRALRSEKEKTLFLAVLSHEIRSPMNAILASMELLMLRTKLPEESRRLLALASGGAENLLYLLNDVLDISKLEAGRLQLELSPVDITELTGSVVDLLALKANSGVELDLVVEKPIPLHLMLDRFRVGQVLHNLISNALKFTSHGHVRVTIQLEAVGAGHQLCIRIEDTGVGIDSVSLKRLFRPYYQASAGTAGKFGGTGLGLTISRQLVELMGGTIALESELGKGTVVSVRIPCEAHAGFDHAKEKEQVAAVVLPASPVFESGPEVLLVEDTLANQAVLQAQLETLGCRSTLAVDGEQALLALERDTYDIVLLDCDLPGISGYEVARQWRGTERARGQAPVPILAISASSDDAHTASCFESGMDGVLKKPIKLGKLKDALQLWTDMQDVQEGDEVSPILDGQAVIAEIWRDVHALRAAIDKELADDAIHHAHRLAGALAVLQQAEMAALARSMEADAKSGAYDAAQIDLERLEALLERYEGAVGD